MWVVRGGYSSGGSLSWPAGGNPRVTASAAAAERAGGPGELAEQIAVLNEYIKSYTVCLQKHAIYEHVQRINNVLPDGTRPVSCSSRKRTERKAAQSSG